MSAVEPPAGSMPQLAFSTLACPEWGPSEVVAAAARYGYDAIEWRGGDEGHVRATWTASQRRALRAELADHGVSALCVTAYTSFVSPDQGKRDRDRADLERHIELARDLGAPFVRAFIGIREDDAPESELRRRAADELAAVAETARAASIRIGLEQHDDFDRAAQVAALLELLPHAPIGGIADVANGWAAGERPSEGIAALGDRLLYLQLKDLAGNREQWQATRFGEGTVPLGEAIASARAGKRGVPICVEWIRAWDATLDPPEIALPSMRAFVVAAVREIERDPAAERPPGAAG